ERLDARTIGKVRGARENDYTSGVICAKVSNYRERVHHPDRLGRPLKRVGPKGEGKFQPISWDVALDEVVHNFKAAADKYGPTTVWPYDFAGTMGLLQRSSIERLRNALKYSKQDSTICVNLARNGWRAGAGKVWGTDPRDILKADLIVVWGGNPVVTQVNVMTHIAKARKERGAKLVVVDAYRTATAEAADMFIAVRPGTDGALACAVMHVLFRDGYADREYMARYADDPDGLEAHLQSRGPEWASPITGVPVAEIEAFAKLYGETKKSYMRVGYGFARCRNGSANMHAVSCLPTVVGSWQHEGGGAMHTNADLYAGIDQTQIMGLDVADPSVRALDMCRLGPILARDEPSLLGGPPVTAMIVQNVNPADVAPDTRAVRAGLARDDLFLCVHEQFMTETAKFADIVLPATMFLEHEDFYRGGGHVYLQVHRAVIEPYAECRSNNDVINELGRRLGSNYPGFYMSAVEHIDASLTASGLPGFEEAADARWLDFSKSYEDANFLNGFGHPDGKFHFAADWPAIGPETSQLPVMPDHANIIDEVTDERPFRMIAPPARRFLNSTFTEMPSSRAKEVRPEVLMHPNACARLG
ncbi:MAG: molybdopterin-dependent oxidoreductase, partial [Rhodospirillaceae bacterium]